MCVSSLPRKVKKAQLSLEKRAYLRGQRAAGRGELLENGEVVVARQRPGLRAEPPGVVRRLPLQLRQLFTAAGDGERLRFLRRMQEGTVAARLGLVQPQLVVEIAQPDRLE